MRKLAIVLTIAAAVAAAAPVVSHAKGFVVASYGKG